MVALTGELVIWLFVIFIPLIVVLFAFRQNMSNNKLKRVFVGLLYGIGTYTSLMVGSYLHDSTDGFLQFLGFTIVSEGAMIYGALIGITGFFALVEILREKEVSGFIAGVTLAFSIFQVYFAVNCVETIPFMENIVKHVCG